MVSSLLPVFSLYTCHFICGYWVNLKGFYTGRLGGQCPYLLPISACTYLRHVFVLSLLDTAPFRNYKCLFPVTSKVSQHWESSFKASTLLRNFCHWQRVSLWSFHAIYWFPPFKDVQIRKHFTPLKMCIFSWCWRVNPLKIFTSHSNVLIWGNLTRNMPHALWIFHFLCWILQDQDPFNLCVGFVAIFCSILMQQQKNLIIILKEKFICWK